MAPRTITVAKLGQFRINLNLDPESAEMTITPIGKIIEGIPFHEVMPVLKVKGVKTVALDLSEISWMNSRGMLQWVAFVKELQASYESSIVNVGDAMIELFNSVTVILGRKQTPLHAFSAPYHCAKCPRHFTRLLRFEDVEIRDGEYVPPFTPCGKCGGEAAFDMPEAEYLRFIQYFTPVKRKASSKG